MGVDRLNGLVPDLHLDRPGAVVEPTPVLEQVVLFLDMNCQVPRTHEELGDLRPEARVDIAALAGVHRLETEVVEESDTLVVADIEEEVDEIGVILRSPAD